MEDSLDRHLLDAVEESPKHEPKVPYKPGDEESDEALPDESGEEAKEDEPESDLSADAEWSEKDHPRGNPGNAGQFTSGGGGAAKAKLSGGKSEGESTPQKSTEPANIGSMTTEEIDRLVDSASAIIARYGAKPVIDRSNISNSAYITFTGPADRGPVKLRISDHELPPGYEAQNGRADAEIGPHGSAAASPLEGIAAALEAAGYEIDPELKAAIAAEAEEAEAAMARRDALQAEEEAYRNRYDDVYKEAQRRWPDQYAAAIAKTGDAKKKAMRKLRDRILAERERDE